MSGDADRPSPSVLMRVDKIFRLGAPKKPPHERPATIVPGERARLTQRRRVAAYIAATLLPAATALALLPLRGDHASLAAIIMVIPVVIAATLGNLGPALLAAVTAGLAYDLTHTPPYWRLAVNDPDDVATTTTLVIVALIVGAICSQLVRVSARDENRTNELQHLVEFSRAATRHGADTDLTNEVCRHLVALLDLHTCSWHPGYHGTASPVLLPTGEIMGYVSAMNPDRAQLPSKLEIPALSGATELGRFIASSHAGTIISIEERLTAATIVSLFASVVGQAA